MFEIKSVEMTFKLKSAVHASRVGYRRFAQFQFSPSRRRALDEMMLHLLQCFQLQFAPVPAGSQGGGTGGRSIIFFLLISYWTLVV